MNKGAKSNPPSSPALQGLVNATWMRPALVIPIAASLLCHAGVIIAIERIGFTPKMRSTVAQTGEPGGIESLLTLVTPPPPPAPPAPLPPSPSSPPPQTPPPTPVEPAPPQAPVAPPDKPVETVPAEPVQLKLSPEALTLWEAEKPAAATPLTSTPKPTEESLSPVETTVTPLPEKPTESPTPTPAPAPVSFAGVESQAVSRVIFAVDISGAMTTSLPYVKEELIQSISRLSPSQQFQIVTFHQPPGASAPVVEALDSSETFIAANDSNKMRAARWIAALEPSGSSQPLAALRVSLASKPDLMFLMTRSIKRSGGTSTWGKGSRETLSELDALNPRTFNGQRTTAIKILQFIDPDPTGMLPAIGNEHGDGPGSYRVITPR